MNSVIKEINKPSKQERLQAMESYNALEETLKNLSTENLEIEIEETKDKIKLSIKTLKLVATILRIISEGKSLSIVAGASEVTTQAAAELLGCSRPYLIKLLEDGKIAYTTVGRHRRIIVEDVMNYKKQMKAKQKSLLIDIMKADEESGLYDS